MYNDLKIHLGTTTTTITTTARRTQYSGYPEQSTRMQPPAMSM